jgi:hypothetical protein
VTIDWSIFWTPQFVIGVVVMGLLLNVVGAYTVRSIDWARKALPASFRRGRDMEAGRVQQLATAAISDHALYAALAAEATRLRVHQLLQFFIAFVCFCGLLLLLAPVPGEPVSRSNRLFVVILAVGGFVLYYRGLGSWTRARRLDTALQAIHKKLKLPVME